MGGIGVRAMTAADWPAVGEIYAEGIASGDATFETSVPSWETWDASHVPAHRFVAVGDDDPARVLGWAACSAVSSRCVYAGVLESSVYVAAAAQRRGVGSALMRALVTSTEADGVWSLQAGVFPENVASLALHERHGFRTIGRRERMGRHGDTWRDVVLLERRSGVVGV
ncbi:GNAT family N-acetyltransferase [Actinotalea subterranea]|uniref:GNAT family N-acetyltransferase n=1 Tax=Actinotalea subterranea TaxID=2607497 RepID=UPI0011EE56CF|nr:GNAT family N-acetyltransferase [Actinotalea subterranea]